jgi:uncharacterized protein (TIGR04255 family)
MQFPYFDRIIFDNNPLEEVICQLRFPTILKIDSDKTVLSQFQDEIRDVYPIFAPSTEPAIDLPAEISQLVQLPSAILGNFNKPNFNFTSEDERWTVSLTNNFIALTCREYEKWEDFEEKLRLPFYAFMKLYKPAFFQRIGLRYVNVIHRNRLGIDASKPWSELLEPQIAGILATPQFGNEVTEQNVTVVVKLEENNNWVRVHHAMGQHKETKDEVYLIDNDFFNDGKTGVDNVFTRLTQYHLWAGQLFQWCITPQLKELLVPRSIRG